MNIPASASGALRLCACLLAAGLAPLAQAGSDEWIPVDAATLDRARGGFTTPGGLAVSLGIERLVSINGELVSRTSFQIADVGSLSAEQARETSAALSAVKLIQNGSENIYMAAFSNDVLGGTVIQNTLNDQQIASQTIINSSVNSAGLLNTMNFNGNVSDAIARAAGPP